MKGSGELADESISKSIWEGTLLNLLFMGAYLQEIRKCHHSLFLSCDGSMLSNVMLCKNKRLTAKLVIKQDLWDNVRCGKGVYIWSYLTAYKCFGLILFLIKFALTL